MCGTKSPAFILLAVEAKKKTYFKRPLGLLREREWCERIIIFQFSVASLKRSRAIKAVQEKGVEQRVVGGVELVL